MPFRDFWDVIRHVRDPRQVILGLIPQSYRKTIVLNQCEDRTVIYSNILERLNLLKSQLKTAAIDDRGRVNYAALKVSDTYRELEMTALGLRYFDPGTLINEAARLAFWLNIYNVLAIHGVIALNIRNSVMEVPSFFGIVAYRVGEQIYTLDEIENGIVRANSPHPAMGGRPFAPGDPRLKYSINRTDPRVHAALVCASKSCPAVQFYEAEKLEEQLEIAVVNWVNGDVTVNETKKRIELPITYYYFRTDFGGETGIRAFLLQHATGMLKHLLKNAVECGFPLYFSRYDWSLNRIA